MKIGIFDSGVGGLSVLKPLLKSKLFQEIIYYGDTARVPYGSKDKNTIISYSLEAVEFFKNFDIDLLVVACNSVSAYAISEIKLNSSFDVVGVIDSGIKATKSLNKDDKILIIGTKATIKSNLYKIGLEKLGFKNITQIATPLFVSLVEESIFSGAILNEVMKYYFKDIKADAVILGCTHFPLIKKEIEKYFNGAKTIHSGEAILDELKQKYNLKKVLIPKEAVSASSNPSYLKQIAKEWL